jgi:hypothetical protein
VLFEQDQMQLNLEKIKKKSMIRNSSIYLLVEKEKYIKQQTNANH